MTGPADVADLSARLDALEMRAAHADAKVEDLSATVAAQWRKIDALIAEVLRLTDRLQDISQREPRGLEPPPPHY